MLVHEKAVHLHSMRGLDVHRAVVRSHDELPARDGDHLHASCGFDDALAGITLLGIMGFLFLPAFFNIPMYLLLVLNTGGAVGDLWAVVRLIFSPSSTLIHDCGDAIEFFRPQ